MLKLTVYSCLMMELLTLVRRNEVLCVREMQPVVRVRSKLNMYHSVLVSNKLNM